eukprot:gnl/Spiro4/24552_TR12174_c0_g1_i1.p2 gnl/Spiro4/24552_TR12174_c0_g1~~gnl/Spiro4/24552_TR12174_c0_g1_i1.p2  ORF type:complete len:115 (+),score=5.83 gnl/Spiro4/24552_TR12174_c0_g1_i1:11-355(+)
MPLLGWAAVFAWALFEYFRTVPKHTSELHLPQHLHELGSSQRPLVAAYRQFYLRKHLQAGTDGFYAVVRERCAPLVGSAAPTAEHPTSQQDTWFLYGRGPVFSFRDYEISDGLA